MSPSDAATIDTGGEIASESRSTGDEVKKGTGGVTGLGATFSQAGNGVAGGANEFDSTISGARGEKSESAVSAAEDDEQCVVAGPGRSEFVSAGPDGVVAAGEKADNIIAETSSENLDRDSTPDLTDGTDESDDYDPGIDFPAPPTPTAAATDNSTTVISSCKVEPYDVYSPAPIANTFPKVIPDKHAYLRPAFLSWEDLQVRIGCNFCAVDTPTADEADGIICTGCGLVLEGPGFIATDELSHGEFVR